MGREQQAQRDRKRDHPLPYRHPGDDVIDQVRGRLCHAPGTATRAEPAPFATEGHELFMGTVGAAQAREGHGRGCRIQERPRTRL